MFVKGIKVKKIVKENKFKGVLGKLEARNCLQKQSLTKYLRQALVFMLNNELRVKFNFSF